MTKVLIRCDMEGLTGVVSNDQVQVSRPEYAFGQRMLMHDLGAVIEGFRQAGADEIVLYDVHATGRNVLLEQLPAYVSAICGKPPYRADWPGGLDGYFAGMAMVGLHGKAGTSRGVLPHSFEGAWADIRLNGQSVGEIGVEAAIAGDVEVPTILVTADDAGAQEAADLLPFGGVFVIVKEALGETSAICLPPAVTGERLRTNAVKALRGAAQVKPFYIAGPVTLEVEMQPGRYLETMRQLFPTEVTDAVATVREDNVTAAWARMWQMSLQTYRAINKEI